MVIPRTFLETEIQRTRKGWRVTYHVRPRKSIFPKARTKVFPTEQEARDWMRMIWMQGNSDRPRRGRRRLTTSSVLWVRPDLVPVGVYATLPELRVTDSPQGASVLLNGHTVAANCQTGRDLKRQLLDHPLGHYLLAEPCTRCGRLPRIELREGTLAHLHEDCELRVRMPADDLVPLTMKIALWNRYFHDRYRPTNLDPVTRPCYMVLGALREPNEREMERRITRIEVIVD